MPSENLKPRQQLGAELVIPVVAVVFTFYYFSTIWSSTWLAKISAFFIGGILLAVCSVFFLRCFLIYKRGEGTLGFATLFNRNDITSGRIGLLVTTVGYTVFIDKLGFTLATFLFLSLSMAVLGRGKRLVLITTISLLMSLGGWAVFIYAFETRFPRGLFEDFMKAALANG
jgi:hypothetical protein